MRFPSFFFRKNKQDDFLRWAKENAVFFDLSEEDTDLEKLSVLDEPLKDKKIVYLGEEDHWVHEKYEYRLSMLRYLVSRGWNVIGEESGWSDGLRVDRFLRTGELDQLERLATFGYRGDDRTDRVDQPSGVMKESADHYPTEAFRDEQSRFFRFLRALRQESGQSLRYFGFDINASAGGGYADVRELLVDETRNPAFRPFWELLDRREGETLEDERYRLQECLEFWDGNDFLLRAELGPGRYGQVWQNLIMLRDTVEFYRLAYPAQDYKAMNDAMAMREEAMLRAVEYMLSSKSGGDKFVLLGHNRHLCKNSDAISQTGAVPGGGKMSALGTLLARHYPNEIFAVWMLNEKGIGAQPLSSLSKSYTPRPDVLNARLSDVGERYLLPLGEGDPAGTLWRSQRIVGLYDTVFLAKPLEQADAIFFVREVHPLQRA